LESYAQVRPGCLVTDAAGLSERFRSAHAAEAFVAAYRAQLARWPLPVTEMDVPGDFGTTRVNVCGPPDGAPLVLMHGAGSTSTAWLASVGALGMNHRVYAVDQMGDAGMSAPSSRPVLDVEDYMSWLDEVLAAVSLPSAAFCGHSYGAWLALNYAMYAPSKVEKLALLDPTECFAGLNLSYRLRAVPVFLRPSAKRARRLIEWEADGVPLDPQTVSLSCLGGGEFLRAKIVMPHPPRADRLWVMNVPTLLLLAEKSRAHDIRMVQANAESALLRLASVVLPGTSHHSLPVIGADDLNRALIDFLA
jgi:pimeloyl-ACP methyl ester carboxylesterase